jgi:hypothetical protein
MNRSYNIRCFIENGKGQVFLTGWWKGTAFSRAEERG